MPEESSVGDGAIGNHLLQAEVHGADNLVSHPVLIVELQEQTVRGERPLDGQPELLLDGGDVILRSDGLGANLLALELSEDVGIDRSESIHLGQLFSSDESYLQLLELLLDLGGHQHVVSNGLRTGLVIELNLLVAWALHSDADLEVTSDLAEVLTLWIEQSNPLVLNGVFVLEVDSGHIELVHANHLVAEDALVHNLDRDRLLLNLALMLYVIKRS